MVHERLRAALDVGKVKNAGFAHYRVPRFTDVPASTPFSSTAVTYPPKAPARLHRAVAPVIANALAVVSGQRLRSLPLVPIRHIRGS